MKELALKITQYSTLVAIYIHERPNRSVLQQWHQRRRNFDQQRKDYTLSETPHLNSLDIYTTPINHQHTP
jgi:hypothetical protein